MDAILSELIKLLGGFAIIVAALAWLINNLINNWLSKDLERHKENLRGETERELEYLKNQLAIIAKEREVRYSKLHEKRADIIAKLYSLLNKLHDSLYSFEFFMKVSGEGLNDYVKPVRELVDYYKDNKIFFEQTVCKSVDDLIFSIRFPMDEYHLVDTQLPKEHRAKKFFDSVSETRPLINEAKNAVEGQFRKLLGVENNVNQNGVF